MRKTRLKVALLMALLFAGCSAGLRPPSGVAGAPAAPAAVERFLQLAHEGDYVGMGWLFGTSDGPILDRDPVGQVEQRMYALASLLQHDGFIIGSGSPVPGRTGQAIRFNVIMTSRGQNYTVPFTAVHGPADRWFVEQFDVEAITGR